MIGLTLAGVAPAAEVQSGPGETAAVAGEGPGPDARARARILFEEGQIHYSLGEYDDAIAKFRQAYALSSAPALLFNVAQAHRLKGECSAALEIYRHFLRLAPDSPYAVEAAGHVDTLQASCVLPAAQPPTPKPQIQGPDTSGAPPPEPSLDKSMLALPGQHERAVNAGRWTARAKVSTGLLAAGVVVAAGTGVLYWWNDTRHDRWSQESRDLAAGPGPNTVPASWIARQDNNDTLLRSIWRVDTAVGVLTAISAACVLGSATLGVLPETGARLAVGPRDVQLAWGIRWP